MNLEERAWQVINIKRSFAEQNISYKTEKLKHQETLNLLKQVKGNLKKAQILYWNEKYVRESIFFKNLYDSLLETYKSVLSMYKKQCFLLKSLKLSIKDRQREISKLNKEL